MVTAPAAKRIIEKGLVSDRVVIQTLVNKYGSHLPLYRQSKTLEQETGLELSRATMDGWVMQVGQMLMPVVGAMKKELLGGSYLQADETPVGVQMHDRRGQKSSGLPLAIQSSGGSGGVRLRLGRGREGPKQFLGKYGGILQTDGYVAYEKVGEPGLVRPGCWTHCRRGFANVVKLNPGDAVAAHHGEDQRPVCHRCRSSRARFESRSSPGFTPRASAAVLEAIKKAVEAAHAGALPGHAFGKACQYALGQWPKLIRFWTTRSWS